MNSTRTIIRRITQTTNRTTRGIGRLAGAVIVGMLSVHSAFADTDSSTVFITVSAPPDVDKQTLFQGFGASINNTVGEFLPSGGRADKSGSTASALYDLLLDSNKPNSLNLTYLRLNLYADEYQKSQNDPRDFSTAVVKTGQADVINAAKSRNPNIKIFYSNWTPPFWMKKNQADYDTTIVTDVDNYLYFDQQDNYANFLGQFCTDFKDHFGYPIDALSFQNEPDVNVSYGSCLYPSNSDGSPKSPATYTSMLTHLRPVPPFSSWSLPQLWGPETGSAKNTDSATNADYIAAAADLGLLNALCLHSYGSNVGDLPFDHRNNLSVNMTEYSLYDNDNKLDNVVSQPLMAAKMADQFCKDVNDGHASTWFWWNCVGANVPPSATSDGKANTGQSLIIANIVSNPNSVYNPVYDDSVVNNPAYNSADHSLIVLNDQLLSKGPFESPYKSDFGGQDLWLTSKYYAFRRLTQSILPRSVNLSTTTLPSYKTDWYVNATQTYYPYQDDVYSSAFLLPNTGKYCIVVANQSDKTYNVNLTVDGLTSSASTGFTTYETADDGVNDASWHDNFANGTIATLAYPHSVFCYVQD